MSLFNRLVFNSPYRVKLSYRTASPPKTSYRTASPPRTSWVSGSVFSRLILPPARLIGYSPKAKKIKILDVHVIYSNMLQSSLTKIGLEGKFFSLHSIRTGSLSEAANSEKVSKSDLQRHTRWKSSMVSYYHKLSLEKKLSVTKSLKLYSF